MKWMEEVNKEHGKTTWIRSFDEYMKIFEKEPTREARPTSLFLRDMFNYFGRSPQGGFNLFSREHSDAPPVHGQVHVQHKIYQAINNFIEEGFNNKFLLLVGPNGSSKSSIIKKIMLATEDYAATEEGALWTFSWIFPIDTFVKGSLGLSSSAGDKHLTSYAYLEDKDISAILTSELKDHPLLLIPQKARQRLIESALKNSPDRLEAVQKSYLWTGDLSQRNRMVFDALLKNHKGNFDEVFKYIRVERLFINRRYSSGATTIEPQLHVDAQMQQITMDRRLASLPPSLQSLNLFNMNGEVVHANRGILEFSDLLKRPLDTFKYLLMTMESKTINIGGILTELDIFFIGSSNEIHFSAFKQHPDFNSFKGRFTFIRVPYLMCYTDELKIYGEQVKNVEDKGRFEPHALEALCLWSVMSRMRAPSQRNYRDERLGKIAEDLDPLEKCLFYSHLETPEYLDSESRQILKLHLDDVTHEFENDGMYEGKFGISPREVKNLIYEIADQNACVTFVEVLDALKDLSEKKQDFDFLNITPQSDYHHPRRHIDLIEEHELQLLDQEVRESLGLVDERSYEDYLSKYIIQINALIKGEKVKNSVTGKFETPDTYFVKEFEANVGLSESPERFRSNLIARLGAYALDNKGRAIVYADVFDDIVKQLQESFRKEQAKQISRVGKGLVFYLDELKGGSTAHALNQETRQLIQNIVTGMANRYGYSQNGAITLLQYLLKKRYDNV
jgi:predicted Ser/Thr protein kinase